MEAIQGPVKDREESNTRNTTRNERGREEADVWLAALRATAPLVPVTAVVLTVFAHVFFGVMEAQKIWETRWYAVALGAVAVVSGVAGALIVWLVFASLGKRYTAAKSANLRNYNLLREKLSRLETRTEHARRMISGAHDGHANGNGEAVRNRAYELAVHECEEIKRGLNGRGMPWVTGLGYVELWHRVHRAEEALIQVEPRTDALAGAMRDEMRLMDSTMKNKDLLLRRLKCAVAMLDDPTTAEHWSYLAEPTENSPGKERRTKAWLVLQREKREAPASAEKALTMLSEVRYEINQFRDNAWEAIVHARNRLVDTSVFLGIAAYSLLGLAVFMNVGHSTTVWVVAYFLVGALAGLFARSQAEWTSNTAVDDFGLSTARLIHVPWLSGLAGVGGGLVTSGADSLVTENGSGSDLVATFDSTPALLIVAAVFGLTPDLLIRRLKQQDEKYKEDLQSTQTSQSTQSGQGTQPDSDPKTG
jgi:hypothetical protein